MSAHTPEPVRGIVDDWRRATACMRALAGKLDPEAWVREKDEHLRCAERERDEWKQKARALRARVKELERAALRAAESMDAEVRDREEWKWIGSGPGNVYRDHLVALESALSPAPGTDTGGRDAD